jgi:hypothetical protein
MLIRWLGEGTLVSDNYHVGLGETMSRAETRSAAPTPPATDWMSALFCSVPEDMAGTVWAELRSLGQHGRTMAWLRCCGRAEGGGSGRFASGTLWREFLDHPLQGNCRGLR